MLKQASAMVFSLSLMGWAQTAVPVAPALESPIDIAVNQDVNLPFDWDAVSGAVSYHIQVSAEADFDPLAANDSGLAVTVRNIGPLKNGTAYNWRVRAKNAAGVGAWSAVRTLTTIVAVPAAAALAKPADKAVDVALKPVYTWRKLTGAADYEFQLSRNEGFTDIAMEQTSLTDTTFTPPTGIPVSTKRWWRIRGRNVGGAGAWSPAWSFTTVPEVPAVPALMTPSDNAAQLTIPVAFKWHKSDRAAAYRVLISSADGKTVVFDTLIAKGDTVLSLDHKIGYGTDYLWQVRGENPGGASAYAASRKFSTLEQPAAPSLITPKADSLNAPVNLVLSWHRAARAADYKVQVSENEAFTGTLVYNDSNLTDTTRAIGPLKNNKAYFWRVRGKNAAGPGGYATVRKFTTIVLLVPPAPALAAPGDGAAGVSPSPVLKWHPSARAASYKVQVSLSPTFATVAAQDSGFKDTTKSVGPLKNDEQYFWRVSARNDAGVGVYSEIRSFTISAGGAAEPVPVSPEDNAIHQPRALDLVWKKALNAVTYRVQVSLKSDFSTRIADDSAVSDTALNVGGLAYGETYYWRVRSQNSAGNSDYSDSRKFTVAVQAPAAVGLVSPADNAEDLKRSLTLKWNASARAALYRVQLSTSASFNTVLIDDSTLTDTSKSFVDLKASTQFFWRVRAKNSGGIGAWSEIRSFRTEPGVAIGRRPVGNGEGFRVVAGRASSAELEFSVKHRGLVRFTVINPANGRTSQLVDQEMAAGTYRVSMGPQGQGRGVYFISMTSGSFHQTQKVLLP